MLLVQVIVVLVVLIAGFVGYYYYNQSTTYLKTNDASITGRQIVIASPVSGKLVNWTGTTGTNFSSGDTVGTVQVQNGKNATNVNIVNPSTSTVVHNLALDNQVVAAGSPLAYAYDLSNLWVTAKIKETQINDVKVGQSVDVYVDAYPGQTFTGTVKQIGLATSSTFSLLPTGNTNANYTKVTQVIPVQIQLQTTGGRLLPGMSASVRIHK